MSDYKNKLKTLLNCLECRRVDDLIEKDVETIQRIGQEITKWSKRGTFDYSRIQSPDQALEIYPDENKANVAILKGHCDYRQGARLTLVNTYIGWISWGTITDVIFTNLKDISKEDWKDYLYDLYNMDDETCITIVRWKSYLEG